MPHQHQSSTVWTCKVIFVVYWQVFDITRKVTYKNLAKWYKELRDYRENIPCIVIANKIDGILLFTLGYIYKCILCANKLQSASFWLEVSSAINWVAMQHFSPLMAARGGQLEITVRCGTTLLHMTSVTRAARIMQKLYTTPIVEHVCGYNFKMLQHFSCCTQ